MPYLSKTHLLIYITGIIGVVFILGITRDNSQNFKENFKESFSTPSVSSASDVTAGASELYGWGYTPIHKEHRKKRRRCPTCENTFIDREDICVLCRGGKRDCRFADITRNVDIDKYVLKSSVPPCPDLTEYAKKNQIPPFPFNKNDYVLKSAIPPCPRMPNMDDYILKSEIPKYLRGSFARNNPGNTKCPICPVSPLCPPCSSCGKKNVRGSRDMSGPREDNTWVPKFSELNE